MSETSGHEPLCPPFNHFINRDEYPCQICDLIAQVRTHEQERIWAGIGHDPHITARVITATREATAERIVQAIARKREERAALEWSDDGDPTDPDSIAAHEDGMDFAFRICERIVREAMTE